jgi:glycosyltransferase involved in cell wall biosynthesis
LELTLVGWRFDAGAGFGVARYAARLLGGLRGRGARVATIAYPRFFDSPLNSDMRFIAYSTLEVLLKVPRTRLYHLTMDRPGFAVPVLKKLYGTKVVTTIHDVNFHIPSAPGPRFPLRDREVAAAARHSDLIITDSAQTRGDLIRNFGIGEERIRTIPLGVDARFRRKKPQGARAERPFTVGYVGGFAGYKSVDFLLRAYSVFEKRGIPSRLVLYGTGTRHGDCVRLARELGIRSAEFRGFAPDDALPGIYNGFDAFVFPSSMEGFGLPVLEAQMCGVPAIVREGARIPEETTRFCPRARDEEHAADLLERIHAKGFRFSREHLAHIRSFTWERCVSKTMDAYGEALGP